MLKRIHKVNLIRCVISLFDILVYVIKKKKYFDLPVASVRSLVRDFGWFSSVFDKIHKAHLLHGNPKKTKICKKNRNILGSICYRQDHYIKNL